jgi:hypothetical protein
MRASAHTPEPRMGRVLLLHCLIANTSQLPANAKALRLSLLLFFLKILHSVGKKSTRCLVPLTLLATALARLLTDYNHVDTSFPTIHMVIARVECPMHYEWVASTNCPGFLTNCCCSQGSTMSIMFVALVCW